LQSRFYNLQLETHTVHTTTCLGLIDINLRGDDCWADSIVSSEVLPNTSTF